MSDADPIAFLFGLERLGMKFGLENMARLCAALDHPERSFQSVHVAGTNGKGSVTAMAETALRAGGYRTARYTSPHLERLEERFVIAGHQVSSGELRNAVGRVQHAVEQLLADGMLTTPPTFFECCTATAFELFRAHGVEIAVVEVGLGGRLDATNVITPRVAAITSIALDHQGQLGETMESIAWEKAGVVKPAVPLVCGRVPAEADAVIGRVCAERGAPLRRVANRVRATIHRAVAPPDVTFETDRRRLEHVILALDGRHQIANAAVAVAVLDALADAGIAVDDNAARSGLSNTAWPARLEHLRWRDAEVLLDAAHNPAGASELAAYLDAIGWTRVTLVFGVMHDKDAIGMLQALAPRCESIVFTTPPTSRALSADDLQSLAAAIALPVTVVMADPEAAIAGAARPGTRVVVAGSLFLIGALRGILR